jgi:peptidoglycan hydrolase CwlO-like protein
MSINFNTLAPISATVISIGGLIFQIGRHSEKLDLLNNKVYAQEKKVDENYKYINDMKIFMSRSDEKLDDMNANIKEIKMKLDKIENRIYK